MTEKGEDRMDLRYVLEAEWMQGPGEAREQDDFWTYGLSAMLNVD